jgi:hypothetical protein
MEINISSFFATVTPCELSGSVAEMGTHAGALTWSASCKASVHHPLLTTEEQRDAFREWVESSGGWDDEEIAAWTDIELNALFLQWIASGLREMGADDGTDAIDWAEVEKMQEEGVYPSNIFRGYDGQIYFSLC